MRDDRLQGGIDYRDLMFGPEASLPARQPAPMPRQVLVFWGPQLALRNVIVSLRDLRRPPRVVQHAVISVPKADEPR